MNKVTGKLYVVATPIGNLDDITHRAKEILSQVAVIAAEDTRHSQGLLNHLGISTSLISYHEHNERERTVQLIDKLKQGESIALISDAGTPLISDPGYWLVNQAHAEGITVIPIPGACAAIAALSASGLPTEKFLFEGFLSSKGQARRQRLTELAIFPYTMVLYEAPHRIRDLFDLALETFEPSRRFLIAREVTKRFESIILSDLQTMVNRIHNGEIPEKGEFIVVIEGKGQQTDVQSEEHEMERVLSVLLTEVPLKQAVQIAVKLTHLHKNALYDCAMRLKKQSEQ
jgi:16S rRNA (cytidine1402-2'-O)-methyltransferase